MPEKALPHRHDVLIIVWRRGCVTNGAEYAIHGEDFIVQSRAASRLHRMGESYIEPPLFLPTVATLFIDEVAKLAIEPDSRFAFDTE